MTSIPDAVATARETPEVTPVNDFISPSAEARSFAIYRESFARATEAIAIIGPDGHYLAQNGAHEALLGYSNVELRHQTPAIHLGQEVFQALVAELKDKGLVRREFASRTKAGDLRTIELTAFAVRDSHGTPIGFVGIKHDVSQQRRAEADLQQKFDELHVIYRMVETVARAGALDEIYKAALDELQHTLAADRASVLLFDVDGVMRFKAWRGLSDEYRRAVEGHSPWKQDELDPHPIVVADVAEDEELQGYLPVFEREGIRALAFIPLVDAGRLLGKFMIYFDTPRTIDTINVQLAQTIARHIAFAISRKRSETALRTSEERYRLLANAGEILSSTLDYEQTLQGITRLVVPAIADWCFIDLLTDDGGFDRIAVEAADKADHQIAAILRRHYISMPEARYGVLRVAREQKPEIVASVTEQIIREFARDDEHRNALLAMRIRSYICVPLSSRDRALGVLSMAVSETSGRSYTEADVSIAAELARRASVAVDNARLYREAQDANRAKSQFLATMSHELRTPLNAIGGYAQLLEMGVRGPLTDLQRDDISRILRSQQHLLGLINDLLHFARIEAGHIELVIEDVNVSDAFDGLQPLLSPMIANRQVRFEIRRGPSHITCRADRDKLRQILLNLATNAIKFTPAGGQVAVAWDATDADVLMHVHDTGPGIPATKLESIFEPFVQLQSPTPVADGTGLGLSISRELTRAMGGEVRVHSTPGRGSTFTCILPRS